MLLLPLKVLICQSKTASSNLVYVDKQGVLRYTKTNAEAAFFGVNYTVPFAYGYRSVLRTGITVEKAIDQDVYHFARLGLDAFRLHVFDTEITDSLGNLLQNEHLRLFDYLLWKLEQRNIKIIITPIAFWGNGYPEKDEHTYSFSDVYGKGQAVVNEKAIKAQENYLKQFFKHINPYTKLTYKDDADVIITELNNEPHHSGPKEKTTEYINRLAVSVRSTGWTKPVFYNISESPAYADAVAKANVDGYSFQWYPTNLVANHTQPGNFLPNADKYYIPFIDTIGAFKNKARIVYEFDAGDVLQSNMYPAMVRSFRTAGFQWATQFAYDPMATAYANTEYQTHYLNLAYTPSKAISLMIAAKAFHKLPRNKFYGTYPADSVFDVFRVSYKEQLSEMNSDEEFYYSNSTSTQPVNPTKLKHIAGVGSSSIIQYNGYGAYFLDKLKDGLWRLEVMPDAIHIRNPFERASPGKEVTRIQWQLQQMQITIPGLSKDFKISAIDTGNSYKADVVAGSFAIKPGTYLLSNPTNLNHWSAYPPTINEFVSPQPYSTQPYVAHKPFLEVTAAKLFIIATKIVGINAKDKVSIEIHNSSNKWRTLDLTGNNNVDYNITVPADLVTPGVINYRIIIKNAGNEFFVFPGNYKGDPYAWDAYNNETWQTYIASENTPLEIFNPGNDRTTLNFYNPDWRNNTVEYINTNKPQQLVLKATINKPDQGRFFGWQQFIANKFEGRQSETGSFTKLLIRARTIKQKSLKVKVAIITNDGSAFGAYITVNNQYQDIEIPLSSLQTDSALLLPRPYPGFQPLMFKASATGGFNLRDADKLEVSFGKDATLQNGEVLTLELESIMLKKDK